MRLDINEAKSYINAHPELYLKPDKSKKGFICPLCGSGSGARGTGLRLNPKDKTHTHYKCFGCGFYGDMVELIAKERGLSGDSAAAFAAAREIYKIDIEYKEVSNMSEDKDKKSELKDYLTACVNDVNEAESYLQSRGIDIDTVNNALIGYDKSKKAIVAITRGDETGYTLRYINPDNMIRYQNATGLKVGLYSPYPTVIPTGDIFITEGVFDALSIIQLGYQAVALNSGSNINIFIKLLSESTNKPTKIYIAMDNDEAGKGFTKTLSEALQELNVPFDSVNEWGDYKDVNELLQRDREALRCILYGITHPDKRDTINAQKIGALLPGFVSYIQDEVNNKFIPTGFKQLDKAIGGGLYAKMYVIGAISSLGKTTFVLQIADNVAQAGNDVLIFSLEMSKEDIIARSISRHTAVIAESKHNLRLAKTELGITSIQRYKTYNTEDKQVIQEAYKTYAAYAADRVSIYEGRRTAQDIKAIVEDYINVTGRKPLVIIDYLQIVEPHKDLKKATIREQVDDALITFADIRREYKTPVIVISSFNRGSYSTVADNTAFKESGTIEYTADAVITLELDIDLDSTGTAEKTKNKTKEKIKAAMRGNNGVRDIVLTFQKNRGNRVGSTIYYKYDARYNYFIEDSSKQADI